MPDLGDLATHWEAAPALDVAVVLVAAVYLRAAGRVRRGWPARRTVAFLAGLAAVVLALQSGLGYYDDERLPVHMAQHLVLMFVAAPLLVAAAPVRVLLLGSRGSTRRALGRLVGSRPLHALGHPVLAVLLLAAVVLGTHFTPFYGLAVRHEALHELEHAAYLAVALLFWWPVASADPAPHAPGPLGRFLYVLVGMLPGYGVGAWLESGGLRYAEYPSLSDQHLAGAVMLTGGGLLIAALALWVVWRALEEEERRARLAERYAGERT